MPRHDDGEERRKESGNAINRSSLTGSAGGAGTSSLRLPVVTTLGQPSAEKRSASVLDWARQISNLSSRAEIVPTTRRQRGKDRCDIRPLISTIGSRRAALDRIRFGHRSDSMNSASEGRQ